MLQHESAARIQTPDHPPARFCRQLAGLFEIEFNDAANIGSGRPGPYTVIDMDLSDASQIAALREWLSGKPEGAKVIFCTDRGSHLQDTRAYAIGATDVLHRPIDGRALLGKLWGEVSVMTPGPSSPAIAKSPAIATAVDTLQSIFTSACVSEDLKFDRDPKRERRRGRPCGNPGADRLDRHGADPP